MEGTRLILVRHGESAVQVSGVVGGHEGCQGLSPRGQEQVERLARRWKGNEELGEVAALYASLMPRACETADILAPAVGDLTPEQDCDFCEHHPGEGDGLPWDEFNERYPLPDDGWSPDLRRDPEGETWNEMRERVARGLDTLVERHAGETVVVACHGGVVVHSMLRWLTGDGFPGANGRAWFNPENSSITEWRYGAPPWGNRSSSWQLVRYNDHAHLLV